jgi:predicted enzyme related to lactoylglutathione lyase
MTKLISWVEIPASDFERAVGFYQSVLKLDLKVFDFGEEKMALFPNDESAIALSPDFKPGIDGTLVSLSVEQDLEAAIERIKANKGTIVQPKPRLKRKAGATLL